MCSDEDSPGAVAGPSSSGHNRVAVGSGEEGESVFSKLEKTRTKLETKLGIASLLEAYELIQVNFFCTECHISRTPCTCILYICIFKARVPDTIGLCTLANMVCIYIYTCCTKQSKLQCTCPFRLSMKMPQSGGDEDSNSEKLFPQEQLAVIIALLGMRTSTTAQPSSIWS